MKVLLLNNDSFVQGLRKDGAACGVKRAFLPAELPCTTRPLMWYPDAVKHGKTLHPSLIHRLIICSSQDNIPLCWLSTSSARPPSAPQSCQMTCTCNSTSAFVVTADQFQATICSLSLRKAYGCFRALSTNLKFIEEDWHINQQNYKTNNRHTTGSVSEHTQLHG
jgi:hypothetical protein